MSLWIADLEYLELKDANFEKIKQTIIKNWKLVSNTWTDSQVYLYNWKIYKIYRLSLQDIKLYSKLQKEFCSYLNKIFWWKITCSFLKSNRDIIWNESETITCIDYIWWETFDIEDFHFWDQRLDDILKSKNITISNMKNFFSTLFKSFLCDYYWEIWKWISNNIWYSNVKFSDWKFVITDCSDDIWSLISQFKQNQQIEFQKHHWKK